MKQFGLIITAAASLLLCTTVFAATAHSPASVKTRLQRVNYDLNSKTNQNDIDIQTAKTHYPLVCQGGDPTLWTIPHNSPLFSDYSTLKLIASNGKQVTLAGDHCDGDGAAVVSQITWPSNK